MVPLPVAVWVLAPAGGRRARRGGRRRRRRGRGRRRGLGLGRGRRRREDLRDAVDRARHLARRPASWSRSRWPAPVAVELHGRGLVVRPRRHDVGAPVGRVDDGRLVQRLAAVRVDRCRRRRGDGPCARGRRRALRRGEVDGRRGGRPRAPCAAAAAIACEGCARTWTGRSSWLRTSTAPPAVTTAAPTTIASLAADAAAALPPTTAPPPPATAPPPAAPLPPTELGQHGQRSSAGDRAEPGERLLPAPQLAAVGPASGAVTKVAARPPVGADAAAVGRGQVAGARRSTRCRGPRPPARGPCAPARAATSPRGC